ncbi:MAG TPA: DUF1570 domain-containing protein [Pirellulales bacterium]|jgi:hypothetical protein|nr:DUF1570 domain-containing protein [Pirellulales bacterium]
MLGYFGKFHSQTACDSPPTRRALKALAVVIVALGSLSLLWLAPARAKDEPPEGEPPREELTIPSTGVVRQGQGQRVLVSDGQGEQVVALLHVEVGDRRLVIMPSGRMRSLAISETAITKKPFRSATKEEVLAELKSGRLAKFKSRSTARYVYLYNTSEEFYRGTSRILETMYPATVAYFKRQKLPVHDPAGPLIVLMFRTEDEFQRYEPVPQGVAAYYSAETNHVVMYEQSDLVEMAPELAVKQAIGVVAHEGVHQVLNNIGVQQRLSRWPLWTAEGLAEYFAPTSVDKRLRWKGVGMPNDFRIHELESLLKKRSNIDGEMVSQTVAASGLSSAGYASAWALTHYLASRKKEKFHAYLREVAKLEPLEPRDPRQATAQRKQLFTKFFGSDYEAIERAVIEHVQSLPYTDPIANQTHYVVMLNTSALRTAGVTSSPASVRRWQEETLTKVPASVRAQATFDVMPFENRSLAEQYARQWLQSR